MTDVPRARVEPLGVEFEVEPGQTLMEAAHRAGLYWPTICGGHGFCNRCFFVTDPDDGAFAPMEEEEHEALNRVRWRQGEVPGERLACQVEIRADVVVRKDGVVVAGPAAGAGAD
jgi:ferredoxin, 2Fe-2S